MKVKICGVCRPEDAAEVARLGADYMGVILAPGRQRSQSVSHAAAIFAQAGGVKRVGVFSNPTLEEVQSALAPLQLDVVQLHGEESPELVRTIAGHCAVWKAIAVREPSQLLDEVAAFAELVDAVVLDHGAGGSGQSFDWTEAASLRENFPPALRIVAAGGLTPFNVAAAIQTLRPAIVDVSTGVESELCVKSAQLMSDFISNAQQA